MQEEEEERQRLLAESADMLYTYREGSPRRREREPGANLRM